MEKQIITATAGGTIEVLDNKIIVLADSIELVSKLMKKEL